MIPKFRIHGDGAELVPYTVPELFFFAGGRTLCFDAAREGDAIGHWHDEIELLYVTEGSMVYNVNGTRCTVHEGEGIFINTRQLHFFEESRCTYRCVLLHPMMLCANTYLEETYITPVTKNAAFPCCILKPEKEKSGGALALIEALFDEADKHNLLRLQSLSYAVWDEICRLAPKPENTVSEKQPAFGRKKHDARHTQRLCGKADAGRDCGRGACMQKRVRKAVSHVSGTARRSNIFSGFACKRRRSACAKRKRPWRRSRWTADSRARAILPGASKKSMAARRKRTAAAAKTRKRKNANRAVLFQSDSVCILFRITGLSGMM